MSRHLPLSVRVAIDPDNPSILRREERCIRCGLCKNVCTQQMGVHGTYSCLLYTSLAAEQTYQSALLEGSLAETAESVTVTQLERELSDAQDKLTDALEDLDTYRHYEDDYDDDYSRLTTLSNRDVYKRQDKLRSEKPL